MVSAPGWVQSRRKQVSRVASGDGNVLWLALGGVWLALAHLLVGVLLFLTVIGIPLGVASMKMAKLALTPFGHRVVDARAVDDRAQVAVRV